MIARIVDRRHRAGLALATSLVGLVAMIVVVIDEALVSRAMLHLVGVGAGRALLALLLVVPAFSAALVRPPVSRPAAAELTKLGPSDVRGLSLAAADRGWSLAIERAHGGLIFVELGSLADARRLVRRLRAGRSSIDGVAIPGDMPQLVALHFLAATASIATAAYFVATHNGKSIGLAFVAALFVAVIAPARVLMARTFRRDRPTPMERMVFRQEDAWGRHAWLHLAGELQDLDAVERERDPSRAFGRADESTRAWLERIDEMASPAGGAYRDAVDEGVLRAIVLDDEASLDQRMGAARVLKKRIGVSIVDQVKDDEARVRIAAATVDDDDRAAEQIEELGPAFRISRS